MVRTSIKILTFWALGLFVLVPLANAREEGEAGGECAYDLLEELGNKTLFGLASWGERWVEYHDPDGTTIIANIDLSTPARAGTWTANRCLEVCYSYPDGSGWCPLWEKTDIGWRNVDPETGEVVHQIYLIQDGDVMNLARALDQADAQAGRI